MTSPADRTAAATERTADNTEAVRPDPDSAAQSTAPTTTAEQNRRTSGQRFVNLVWEVTQSAVALVVVLTTAAGIFIGRTIEQNAVPFPAEWWTIVGLVIGFYFGRTNHARIGDEPRESRRTDPPGLDDRT